MPFRADGKPDDNFSWALAVLTQKLLVDRLHNTNDKDNADLDRSAHSMLLDLMNIRQFLFLLNFTLRR